MAAGKRNLYCVEVHFMPNPHPFEVNPWIGLLCTLEGFAFVSRLPLPDTLVLPVGLEQPDLKRL